MDDDRIENFSDVWWKVQHECDMYEEKQMIVTSDLSKLRWCQKLVK